MNKAKIKPLRDFADKIDNGERLFIAGKYYTVPVEKAKEYSDNGLALVRKRWQEGNINHSTYTRI